MLVVVLDCLALTVQPVDDFDLVGKIVHNKNSIEVHLDVSSSLLNEWLPGHVTNCRQVALASNVAKGLVTREELVDVLLLINIGSEGYFYLVEA